MANAVLGSSGYRIIRTGPVKRGIQPTSAEGVRTLIDVGAARGTPEFYAAESALLVLMLLSKNMSHTGANGFSRRYRPYRGAVDVAGFGVNGLANAVRELDVFVPGAYRWSVEDGARVAVDEVELSPGNVVSLGMGKDHMRLIDPVRGGMLIRALRDPPSPSNVPFYSDTAIQEITGLRPR
jgi:hypothetical protein